MEVSMKHTDALCVRVITYSKMIAKLFAVLIVGAVVSGCTASIEKYKNSPCACDYIRVDEVSRAG
jgi:hypothetical protein